MHLSCQKCFYAALKYGILKKIIYERLLMCFNNNTVKILGAFYEKNKIYIAIHGVNNSDG
ncbi:MAG: hypothetical protein NEHIOOID_00285 [Holosporales bacterium]